MAEIEFLENGNVRMTIPLILRSCAGRKRVVSPDMPETMADPLVLSVVRAFRWQEMIDNGDYANVHELANALGKDFAYVARTIRLALLCPDIIHAVLNGTLPEGVTLDTLRIATVDDWSEQKEIVGMV